MKTPIKLLPTDLIAVEVPKDTKICDFDFICGYCKELFNLDPNFNYQKIGEATEDLISENLKEFLKHKWSWCEDEFRSLLKSSGLNWINEYQNDWDELCTWGHGDFSKDGKTSSALYFEAESKRIKGKLIFLKIIKL